uniref:C2H2-type domain-containing protein n=1 Tax=Acanthochromis polyacanthus TaxID=80966 RepID=A0A3Q1EK05_9TELE
MSLADALPLNSLDETKSWDGQANTDKRKSAGKDQSRPGAEVIQKTGIVIENQINTWTPCSAPTVSNSVQASMPSTSSVGIPATLSASVPSNISAHLSSPAHQPFQCSLCDRSFSQRGSLNRHVRSHLGVRPFPCPHCPMTFSRLFLIM